MCDKVYILFVIQHYYVIEHCCICLFFNKVFCKVKKVSRYKIYAWPVPLLPGGRVHGQITQTRRRKKCLAVKKLRKKVTVFALKQTIEILYLKTG